MSAHAPDTGNDVGDRLGGGGGADPLLHGDEAARAGEADAGPVVLLDSVWWKNPFLWLTLGTGIPVTAVPWVPPEGGGSADPGNWQGWILGFGVGTLAVAYFAHFALRARLEIRPKGFREVRAIGRTVWHRWEDVSEFVVWRDPESRPIVAYSIRKNGKPTAEGGRVEGAYQGTPEELRDRMNAARDRALAAAAAEAARGPEVEAGHRRAPPVAGD